MSKVIRDSIDIAQLSRKTEENEETSKAELPSFATDSEWKQEAIAPTPERVEIQLQELFDLEIDLPSAEDAIRRSKEKAQEMAADLVRDEATEVLEKAKKNIDEAIQNGLYVCEIMGPARAEHKDASIDSELILKKNLREYHPDTLDAVKRFFEKCGYQTEIDATIGIVIRWG